MSDLSDDPNVTFKQMNVLLMNSESEKRQYENISEMNLKEITDSKNRFLHMLSRTETTLQQEECLNRYLKLKEEKFVSKVSLSERKAQLEVLKTQIKKKQRLVSQLQTKHKDLTEVLGKLKLENENINQKSQASLQIFQKALKFYTQYFQYTIQIDEQETFLSVVINLIFGDKKSPHSITFNFDKDNNLLDFTTDELVTSEQHAILLDRFKKTNNYIALFTTLKTFAYKKSIT